MNQRELLYTAVTRARKYLHIICEPDTFFKGTKSQKVKGNTIAEKAEYFKGKQTEQEILDAKVEKIVAATTGTVSRHAAASNFPTPITTTIKGQKAVRLADLVPGEIAETAANNLAATWEVARQKFAYKGDIGPVPHLSFEINSKSLVGRAYMGSRWEIQLNPIWLACGDDDVVQNILSETIIHEACHCIAYKLFQERAHGKMWKFCMLRMGIDAARLYEGELPPWAETRKSLLTAVLLNSEQQPSDATINETEE
jgi:hypothetical protein